MIKLPDIYYHGTISIHVPSLSILSEGLRIARGGIDSNSKKGRLFADRDAAGNRQRHLGFIKNVRQCRNRQGTTNTEKSDYAVRSITESLTP